MKTSSSFSFSTKTKYQVNAIHPADLSKHLTSANANESCKRNLSTAPASSSSPSPSLACSTSKTSRDPQQRSTPDSRLSGSINDDMSVGRLPQTSQGEEKGRDLEKNSHSGLPPYSPSPPPYSPVVDGRSNVLRHLFLFVPTSLLLLFFRWLLSKWRTG